MQNFHLLSIWEGTNFLKKVSISLIFLISIITNSAAQEPITIYRFPSASDLIVVAHCIVQPVSGGFSFSYTVSNSSNSRQKMDDFYLDIQSAILRINTPSNWWGPFPDTNNPMMWFSIDTLSKLDIGGQMSDFMIESPGLPAINQFYARGYVEDTAHAEEPDSIENDDIFINSYKDWTISPKDPNELNQLQFIDTIKYYINQSRSLGWILNEPTKQKYIDLLDTARALVERGSGRSARQTLDAVLENVESDKVTSLTSEAYALIRYNTEYLVHSF